MAPPRPSALECSPGRVPKPCRTPLDSLPCGSATLPVQKIVPGVPVVTVRSTRSRSSSGSSTGACQSKQYRGSLVHQEAQTCQPRLAKLEGIGERCLVPCVSLLSRHFSSTLYSARTESGGVKTYVFIVAHICAYTSFAATSGGRDMRGHGENCLACIASKRHWHEARSVYR